MPVVGMRSGEEVSKAIMSWVSVLLIDTMMIGIFNPRQLSMSIIGCTSFLFIVL